MRSSLANDMTCLPRRNALTSCGELSIALASSRCVIPILDIFDMILFRMLSDIVNLLRTFSEFLISEQFGQSADLL